MTAPPIGYERCKRLLDVTSSALILVLAAPVMALIALALTVDLGRPVFFRQLRPGVRGEPFELIKFRSMRPANPAAGLVEDGDRISPFSRWLRSTSLDELPTMFNVLRGEMSMVGPRPLLMQYLSRYTPEQARRHEVRPGVTGLAQVRGRNSLTWEQRFAYDVAYVDNRSLRLDLRILAQTGLAVVRREGINASGRATMYEFAGSGSQQVQKHEPADDRDRTPTT